MIVSARTVDSVEDANNIGGIRGHRALLLYGQHIYGTRDSAHNFITNRLQYDIESQADISRGVIRHDPQLSGGQAIDRRIAARERADDECGKSQKETIHGGSSNGFETNHHCSALWRDREAKTVPFEDAP